MSIVEWGTPGARVPAPSIGELARRAHVVEPSLACADLERIFLDDPTLTSVLLNWPYADVKLISQARFFTTLIGRMGYGRMLLVRSSLGDLPTVETLVLEADTSLSVAAAAAATRTPECRQDDVTVRFADGALGTLAVSKLFAELALGFGRLVAQNASILEAAGEGIYGLGLDGRTTFVNPAAAHMVGREITELLGQSAHDLAHHAKPNGSSCRVEGCPVSFSLPDGKVHHSEGEVFWRKDGSSFPVEYTSTPIVEDGRLKGAVVVFKDITERRAVQRAKDEFTSVVSHELRTPLTSIRASLGLLESGVLGPLPEQGQRMVEIAVQNTDRLVRLINDILDIERIGAGEIDMHQAPCDAAELIERAVEELRPIACRAQVQLKIQAEAVALFADRDRVHQILTNLISNAVKFSQVGATVRVCSERRYGEALFVVSDDGRGIPAEKLELIFERFQQVDASDSREKSGTGLGLAICRTIVERHGGRIWACSELGRGATFSFLLPVLGEQAPIRSLRPAGP